VCFVVTEAQVKGATIPEAIAMETAEGGVGDAVPVARVPEGAALGPEAPAAPEIIEGGTC
jgi:hypothetical protein